MKELLCKEFRLALHPAAIIFLSFGVMLLIPNYPYLVAFFYLCLGIFFICLTGRENKDIYYMALLPIRKRDAVKARMIMVAALELLQIIISIPFAILRNSFPMSNNAGMDANIALYAAVLILFAGFNYSFFTNYYKNPNKVGRSFFISGIVMTIVIGVLETGNHVIPFMKNVLDAKDPQFFIQKLLVLFTSIILYILVFLLTYNRSADEFDKIDI